MYDLNANDLAYLLNRLELERDFHDIRSLRLGERNCRSYGKNDSIEICTCNLAALYRSKREQYTRQLNQELSLVTEEQREIKNLEREIDHVSSENRELKEQNEKLLDQLASRNEEIEKITGKPTEDVARSEANAAREEFAALFCRFHKLTSELTIDELVQRRNQLTRAIALLKIHRHAAYLHEMDYIKKADYAEKQRIAELDKSFKPKEKIEKTVKKSDNEKAIEAMMKALGMSRENAEKAFLSMRK